MRLVATAVRFRVRLTSHIQLPVRSWALSYMRMDLAPRSRACRMAIGSSDSAASLVSQGHGLPSFGALESGLGQAKVYVLHITW